MAGPASGEVGLNDFIDRHLDKATVSLRCDHLSCDLDPTGEPLEIDGADLATLSPTDLIFSAYIHATFLYKQTFVSEKTYYSFAPRGPPVI